MQSIAAVLAEHPFMKGLTPRQLEVVAACGEKVHFKPGQFLCRDEEEVLRFYLVYQGRVAVEIFSHRRGAVTIRTLVEGEELGWLWFDKPYHWHLDARAVELTRTVALDVNCLRQACEADHDLGYEILKRYGHSLAVRFRILKLQLVDMYGG
ncbi:MAG: cyclic nucleotide-binding domain-containing protein [Deltaproteobacteria bacterium]|nr:cyclic nucleotide-binding domain-containing protein [Deltaproteobacteria bacterium]